MNKTGKLVLGTVQFGCQYGINSAGRPSQEAVDAILKEASAAGMTTLDTSCAYGDSEQVLGSSGSTGSFQIVSKYLQTPGSTVGGAFAQSLERLKTDHLYGYLIHHFSDWTDNPAIWDEFRKLKDNGSVRRIGFSLYSPDELERLLAKDIDFDILQFPHNIFDRKFDPYLPSLKDRGVEIHVRSTFLQGLFFKDRDSLSPKMQPLRKYLLELDAISAETGLSIAELALNYNIQNPFIDGVLIGVDNLSQLRVNLASICDKTIEIDINIKEQELLNPVNWN